MTQRDRDIRTTVMTWIRGRRLYMAGGIAALMLVVVAVARFAPPADAVLAEDVSEAPAAPEAAAAPVPVRHAPRRCART